MTLFVTAEKRVVPPVIKRMADNILKKYSGGVTFVDTEWKGDAEMTLCDKFNAKSQHEDEARTYEMLSNEMSLGNGFTQVTKGRCVGKKTENAIMIDEDNAFRFSLPVKSRTIINQVNVSYIVLEEDDVPYEEVTINYRDCEFLVDTYDKNVVDEQGKYKFIAIVKLEKVYERVESIAIDRYSLHRASVNRIISATTNSLIIEFTELSKFSEFKIIING